MHTEMSSAAAMSFCQIALNPQLPNTAFTPWDCISFAASIMRCLMTGSGCRRIVSMQAPGTCTISTGNG